jgi:hypothetical protein
VVAFGTEQLVAADRAYAGSRFADVRDALLSNPYVPTWPGPGRFPRYPVTLASVLHGVLSRGKRYRFEQAVARVIDSHADLRWGADGKGYRRLLHPNGICLLGEWRITAPTEYTGYFRQGSHALVIGRYSTCCTETRRGHARSLALVLKLFPTFDPEHAAPLPTASVITQQDLGGDFIEYINDVQLLNAPDTTGVRRGTGIPVFVVTGTVFSIVDRRSTIRQLYEVAELGQAPHEATRAPEFVRLSVARDQPRIPGVELDFRDEIMQHIFDAGDPAPKRRLRFTVEVTDSGQTRGIPGLERRTFQDWRTVGSLEFDNAVVSYNGDFVIHFHHPTWRDDRNDPATATRVNERKVRWIP